MTSVTPKLMRAKQACEYLSMGRSLFYQMIADGYLPKGTPIRKHYVVWYTSDLDEFVSKHFKLDAQPSVAKNTDRGDA